jgi:hypothetical protein
MMRSSVENSISRLRRFSFVIREFFAAFKGRNCHSDRILQDLKAYLTHEISAREQSVVAYYADTTTTKTRLQVETQIAVQANIGALSDVVRELDRLKQQHV